MTEPFEYLHKPAFSVFSRNDQVLNLGVNVLTFTNSHHNDVGAFNLGTGIFTCPKAGRLQVTCQSISLSTTATTTFYYVLYSPQAIFMLDFEVGFPNTKYYFAQGAAILNVDVGDQVYTWLECSGGYGNTKPTAIFPQICHYFQGQYLT